MNKKILLLGTFLLLIGGVYTYKNLFSFEAKLDKYVKAYVENGLFSGSVLVAKDGKVLLCKGYGMADYEFDIPNKPRTKFRIGSITKQFTAMAIMQLQEKGFLDVNDPVAKYIPDYPQGDKITIRHLLTHTSGIPNLTESPDVKKIQMEPHSLDRLIASFKDKPLEFTPGEKFKYTNSGYILLGYIIEKVSGKKYETFLKENIFDPLGMIDSGYDNYKHIIKHRATGYCVIDDELANADYIDMSYPAGAGALYSTVEDLYLWDQALYTEKLISQKSLDEMCTPFKDEYGYGWVIKTRFNHKLIEHPGGIDGFSTIISRYPDNNVCIIILSNFEHAHVVEISKELAAIVFDEKQELPNFPKKRKAITINPEIYNHYVGEYRAKDFTISVTTKNNELFVQPSIGFRAQLHPESEAEFFVERPDAQVSFIKDESGKIVRLIFHQGEMVVTAEKFE